MAVKVDLIEGQFTREEYLAAIQKVEAGLTQLEPDGLSCAICGDSGHQAWECHHNPLVLMRRAAELDVSYKCFHCGGVFRDDQKAGPFSARAHFGGNSSEDAACRRAARRAGLLPMELPDDSYFPERGGE